MKIIRSMKNVEECIEFLLQQTRISDQFVINILSSSFPICFGERSFFSDKVSVYLSEKVS